MQELNNKSKHLINGPSNVHQIEYTRALMCKYTWEMQFKIIVPQVQIHRKLYKYNMSQKQHKSIHSNLEIKITGR